jgi:hypothetical protein
MKKLATAAALAMTLGTGATYAGGIQLNMTNPGQAGGSVLNTSFANSPPFGSALVNEGFSGSTPDGTGTLLMQSIAGPISAGGVSGYLTYQFVLPVTVTGTATQTVVSNSGILVGDDMVAGSEFFLFFTPNSEVTAANFTSGAIFGNKVWNDTTSSFDADAALLTGQKLLASGTLRIDVPNDGGSFTINDNAGTLQDLAGNQTTTKTIRSNPSNSFEIDITTLYNSDGTSAGGSPGVDTFVINDLAGLAIDMNLSNQGFTAYRNTIDPTTGITNYIAPATIVGVTPDYGLVGEGGLPGNTLNNFGCTTSIVPDTDCDFQFQVGGSLTFNAEGVPEPASLALVGLGLVGFGWAARKRSAAA